jgi:hypothetical protein
MEGSPYSLVKVLPWYLTEEARKPLKYYRITG